MIDRFHRATTALSLVLLLGCGGGLAGPGDGDDGPHGRDLRILFVGNSLTYTNDLPGIVQGIADEAGLSISHTTIAHPDWSLEEHWAAGIADQIREMRPDIVVLQQGPSTLESSGEHLVHWTSQIAPVVEQAGGETALLMVWPPNSRLEFMDAVRDHYREAAEAVDGYFIPAGEAWTRAWAHDPGLALYDWDGFHPSYLGSLTAAQTVAAVLLDLDPSTLSDPRGSVGDQGLQLIRAAVRESLEIARRPGDGAN